MITIQAYTIGQTTAYPGSSCELRIYSNQSFTASDGSGMMAATPQNGNFYISITCPISGGQITIPQINLESTGGLDSQTARYDAIFFSGNTRKDVFLDNFPLPASLPSPTTWSAIRINKSGLQPLRDLFVYTKTEVQNLIQQYIQGQVFETFTGNGVTTQFTVSRTPVVGSELVIVGNVPYLNQPPGDGSYSTYQISGPTVTFDIAPDVNAPITIWYRINSGLVGGGVIPNQVQEASSTLLFGSIAARQGLKRSTGSGIVGTHGPGFYNAQDEGAATDGNTDTRAVFNTLVNTTMGGTGEIWIPPGIYLFDADFTFPADVRLVFAKNAFLRPANGVTITILGPIDGGSFQFFVNALSGQGSISLAGNAMSEMYAQWWGATFNNSTDDAPAINAAIASLGSTVTTRGGPQLRISGPAAIGSTILINRKSLIFCGLGWGRQGSSGPQSYLRWIGAAGSPMLRLQNVQGVSVRDLRLIGNASAKPSCGISLFQEVGFGNNQNTLQNIAIGDMQDGTAIGVGFTNGISFEGAVANNDTWHLDNIMINGFTDYGIRQNSIQNVACTINNLSVTNGRDGVYICASVTGNSWSFGSMSGTLIILPRQDDSAAITEPRVIVDWLTSDSASSRFVEFLGNGIVALEGGTYATGSATASDGKIVKHEADGNVIFRLVDFKWTAGVGSPATAPYLSFRKTAYMNQNMDTIILDGVPALPGGPNGNGIDAESRGILDQKFIFWRPPTTSPTEYGPIVGAVNYLGGDFGGGQQYDPYRFDIPARLRRPPSANPQVISAVGNTILADRSLTLLKNTTGSLTLTSTPTIADGANGEIVRLMNIGTQNIVLQDQGTLGGSNLRLTAASVTLAPRQSVELTFIATPGAGTFTLGDWVQTSSVVTVL